MKSIICFRNAARLGLWVMVVVVMFGWAKGCTGFRQTQILVGQCRDRIETLQVYILDAGETPPATGLCDDNHTFVKQRQPTRTIRFQQGDGFELPNLQTGQQLYFRFQRTGHTPYCEPCAEGTQADTVHTCTLTGPPQCFNDETPPNTETPPTETTPEPNKEPTPEPPPSEPKLEPSPDPPSERTNPPEDAGTPELPTDAGCIETGTCPNGLACIQGRCVPCMVDQDCGKGFLCIRALCRAGNCRSNQDCSPPGQICKNFLCSPCTNDGECAADESCKQGFCLTGECLTNEHCANNLVCRDQRCLPCQNTDECKNPKLVCQQGVCIPGSCVTNADCPNNLACLKNTCAPCNTDSQCAGSKCVPCSQCGDMRCGSCPNTCK